MMRWTQQHEGRNTTNYGQFQRRQKGGEGKPDNAIMKVTFDFILFHMKIS